ncbi:MAG: lipoprotein [Pseudomonadota bacterium]
MLAFIDSSVPRTRVLLVLFIAAVLLGSSACGLKGDLYLPETDTGVEPAPAVDPDTEDEDDRATPS